MVLRVRVFFLLLLLLAAAVAAVLATEESRQRRPSGSEAFQQLVGGLGFGPSLDLSDCVFGFDPRLDGACSWQRGPIPAGACFCPRHAGSIFFYPPVGRKEADALPR